jgi:GABA(A) receptor-associated protein
MDFKDKNSFDYRLVESSRIRDKYTERIPVICQKLPNANRDCPDIDKKKYLIPLDLTIGQFIWVIRNRLKLPSEKALYIFINGVIPPIGKLMSKIDEEHRDKDGFVYFYYNLESTFG